MKNQQQVHVCDECDKQVPFDRTIHFEIKDVNLKILDREIVVKDQKVSTCPDCEQEISDDILDSELLMNAIETWERETGKVYADQFSRKS